MAGDDGYLNCKRARSVGAPLSPYLSLSLHEFFRSALASPFKCQESNAIRRAPLPAPLPPSIGHLQCHRARRRPAGPRARPRPPARPRNVTVRCGDGVGQRRARAPVVGLGGDAEAGSAADAVRPH